MKIKPSRVGHIAVMQMAYALHTGPQTVADLIELTGLCSTTLRHYVLTGRKQKVLYVAEWHADERGRLTAPAYAFGKKHDAARTPMKRDNAERMRAYAQRDKFNQTLHLLAA